MIYYFIYIYIIIYNLFKNKYNIVEWQIVERNLRFVYFMFVLVREVESSIPRITNKIFL